MVGAGAMEFSWGADAHELSRSCCRCFFVDFLSLVPDISAQLLLTAAVVTICATCNLPSGHTRGSQCEWTSRA